MTEISYSHMLSDVQKIIDQLQQKDLDLDQIVTKVESGFQTIQTLRLRLEQTKGRVESLKTQYDSSLDKSELNQD
jgi:exodeoxyribonuclease VII small subunit